MNRIHMIWLASAGIASIGMGCASTPLATGEISRARSALEQAEANGGGEFAALEVRNAREKLAQANRLSEEGEGLEARRTAEEAEVDALLAVEKARRGKATESAEELRESIDAMEEEMTDDDLL